MGNTFFIVWRESLEAMLVVGILYSCLSRGGEFRKGLRFMWAGVAAGALASVILAAVTVVVQDELSGRALELFQSGILIAAAFLMTQMVMWMRHHGRTMKKKIENDLNEAMNSSQYWGVAFVAAAAIAREGTETAVYLYGMSLETRGLGGSGFGPVAVGSIAGLIVAALTAGLVSRGIRFLNYQRVFQVTGIALLISAAGLLVNAVNRLIELDVVPALVNPVWNTSGLLDGGNGVGKFLFSFAGYQPRPSLMIVLVYLAYWLGTWAWIRSRTTRNSMKTFNAKTLISMIALSCGLTACNGAGRLAQPDLKNTPAGLASGPATREYWIAAESEAWNIAPGPDAMTGAKIPAEEATIHSLRFFAYSPGFKDRLESDPLLGIAGPVIEADIGDQVVIHFRNNDHFYHQPHSLHLHGLRYEPASDGGYSAANPGDPASKVEEGAEFTYHYSVPNDSSGVWPYHDHSVEGAKNTDLGLYGAVRVHAPGESAVDREFYVFLSGFEKNVTGLVRDFDTINGLAYMGNTPHFMVKRGNMVRFNVIGFGSEFHTFHIHGYHWQHDGQSEDVRLVGPATAWSVSFRADNPGMWMYHCHVDEHARNGMMGMFMVE